MASGTVQAAHDEIDLLDREISSLNEQCDELEYALQESVKLQSHYAGLLNMHDGGKRLMFGDTEAWLNRLRSLAPGQKLKPKRKTEDAPSA